MKNEPNIRIEVTDGAVIPDPKEKYIINAWNIAFFGSILLITLLCVFGSDAYINILKFIPDGIWITFEVTFLSLLFTLPLGVIAGLGRLSQNRIINLVTSTYVEIIRGIPLLVQLFYIYYALGQFSPLTSAVISISFCYGAYMGEVFKAGLLAVPKGQFEAAYSLGFNSYEAMRYVILPQAIRTILPPLGNECIAMLKDTSLISIIAVADILRRGREYASQTFEYFETYTLIALLYLIITLLLSKGISIMEGKLNYYDEYNT